MAPTSDLENQIREIGSQIYSSVTGEIPLLFDTKKWTGRLMDWAMKDETFRLRLFRYVDVLPSLKSDALIVKLLEEYFEDIDVPFIIRKGIERSTRGNFAPYIAARLIKAGVESIAEQFIVGEDPEDSLKSLISLWKDGFAFTIDVLGEVVLSDKEADAYSRNYLRLLDFLRSRVMGWAEDPLLEHDGSGPIPRFDISVKVSSLFSRLDPLNWEGSIAGARENLRRIFKKAQGSGASICLDMEQYYYKDLIIAAFRSILEEFPNYPFAGIAIQAYLKDAKDDLLSLMDWTRTRGKKITVRLVKGAYWDYETVINRRKGWPVPVFQDKEETDANFEELTRILLENVRFVRPAVATHNIRSISNAIAIAKSLNLPKNSFEFQMLYGMGEPLRKVLRKMDYRVRVYTPLGRLIPGMAYLVRRLLENTSNESFIRRSVAENRPFEELIKPPERKPSPELSVQEGSQPGTFRNEPPIDFSKAENRTQMSDALQQVRRSFDRRYPLIIGGKEILTGKEIISLNPAHPEEIVGRVSVAGVGDAERALEKAKEAFVLWRSVSPAERAGYLFRAAEEIRKERYALAALEVFEAGKTWRDADGDVAEAVDYLEYYGREMVRLAVPRRLGDYPGEANAYYYEPKGIGVVISPWNFPLAIPAGMVSAGIVTGNCVIFKPSGLSPVLGWKLMEIFKRAGLPPGVLQFLPGTGAEIGDHLVSHPGVDFVAFTGSKDVGLEIIRKAGETNRGQRNIKKVIAEMGGKNAIIVDETADIDEAVSGVLESSMGYQGQKCSACSRVIIVGGVFEEFTTRLREAMISLKIGPPEKPETFLGPVIDGHALDNINEYIGIGKKDGKPLLSVEAKGVGYFVGPVLLADLAPESPVVREEIFGPVLTAVKAKDMEEALEIANDSLYALTGGIFSRSPDNLRKAKRDFRAGNLYINRRITGALVGRQPFGGFGMSGVSSKAGGPDYLHQFMNPKSVSENTLRKGFASSVGPLDIDPDGVTRH